MFGVITCYRTFIVTSAHGGYNFKLRTNNNMLCTLVLNMSNR